MHPILHVYTIERNGYALKEAPPEEDIHPPSQNEKSSASETATFFSEPEVMIGNDSEKLCRSTL